MPSHHVSDTAFGPYKLLKTLGEGEFGKVKLAVHHVSKKSVFF
jgi:serine/threonine protein kinase